MVSERQKKAGFWVTLIAGIATILTFLTSVLRDDEHGASDQRPNDEAANRGSASAGGQPPASDGSGDTSGPPAWKVLWQGRLAVATYAVDLDVVPPDRDSDDASRDISLGFPFGGIGVITGSARWEEANEPTPNECADRLSTQSVVDRQYEGAGTTFCVDTTGGRVALVKLGEATKEVGGSDESVEVDVTVWEHG